VKLNEVKPTTKSSVITLFYSLLSAGMTCR